MGAADVYGRKTEEDETEDGQADTEPAAPAEVRHACRVPSGLPWACARKAQAMHISEKRKISAWMTHAGVR